MPEQVSMIPLFARESIPGQVPRRFREVQQTLRPAEPMTAERSLYERPIHTAEDVVRGLNLPLAEEVFWRAWIHQQADQAVNELHFRHAVASKLLHDRKPPEIRRQLLSRGLSYYRGQVATAKATVYTPDEAAELLKAGARYYRRVPDAKAEGGYRYVFDQHYSRRPDGDDGTEDIKSSLDRLIGEKGCRIANLKSLVVRYGSKRVAKQLAAHGCEIRDGQVLRKTPASPEPARAKQAKAAKQETKKALQEYRFLLRPDLL